ncbi:MAG: VWA domain-containing protein, partial [Acidobacteria bacterium]|nr:VWA domain-containing protein [Acidobacteriota bacterium]
MKFSTYAAALLWVLGALAGPLEAQEVPSEPAGEEVPPVAGSVPAPETDPAQELFLDNITVNVVNVEVVVTDKDGKPVKGLKPEDFEVYEDKRPMEITNFYAVEDGQPRADVAPEAPTPGDETVPGLPLEPLSVPEDQRLSLIIFIDHFNIHALNRNRVMRDVRQFLLQNVKSGDRVMLVTYTRSLKVVQRFTTDPRLVAAALNGMEKDSGFANLRDTERRDVLKNIDDAQSSTVAFGYARTYADSVYNDLTFTIRALKELVEQLAGLPGRKMILHVSDGIPMVAGQEIFTYVDSKYSTLGALNEAFSYDASRQFQQLAASANSNGVVFNMLDAAGLRTSTFTDASYQGAPGQGQLLDSTLIHNLQDPLHMLANLTGGRAIV